MVCSKLSTVCDYTISYQSYQGKAAIFPTINHKLEPGQTWILDFTIASTMVDVVQSACIIAALFLTCLSLATIRKSQQLYKYTFINPNSLWTLHMKNELSMNRVQVSYFAEMLQSNFRDYTNSLTFPWHWAFSLILAKFPRHFQVSRNSIKLVTLVETLFLVLTNKIWNDK